MKAGSDTLRDRLDAMAENGAGRFDPVRFSYIESLARRAARMPNSVRRQVEEKAAAALADYETCFDRAQKEAKDLMANMASAHPEAMAPLRLLYSEKDFKGIERMSRKLRRTAPRSPLRVLVERISGENRRGLQVAPSFEELLLRRENEMLQELDNSSGRDADLPPGSNASNLKSYQLFRETWARHYSDRLVSDAVRKLPENPGPLNSQYLITRSLVIMRDLSPDYLKRFVSYVDTLLWLEDAAGKRISHEDIK